MRMTYEEFIKKNKDTLSIHYKEDHGDDPSEAELEEYVEEAYGTYCYYAANYNG